MSFFHPYFTGLRRIGDVLASVGCIKNHPCGAHLHFGSQSTRKVLSRFHAKPP